MVPVFAVCWLGAEAAEAGPSPPLWWPAFVDGRPDYSASGECQSRAGHGEDPPERSHDVLIVKGETAARAVDCQYKVGLPHCKLSLLRRRATPQLPLVRVSGVQSTLNEWPSAREARSMRTLQCRRDSCVQASADHASKSWLALGALRLIGVAHSLTHRPCKICLWLALGARGGSLTHSPTMEANRGLILQFASCNDFNCLHTVQCPFTQVLVRASAAARKPVERRTLTHSHYLVHWFSMSRRWSVVIQMQCAPTSTL